MAQGKPRCKVSHPITESGPVYHLAQINIGKFRVPAADPVNAEFIGSLDRVNALAESQPGFIWRLKGDGNSAIGLHAYSDGYSPQTTAKLASFSHPSRGDHLNPTGLPAFADGAR